MIFQKKIRAGVLLYALLMLAVFSMLLQFYLQGQLATAQNRKARQEEAECYVIALMTRDAFLKEVEMAEKSKSEEESTEKGENTESTLDEEILLEESTTPKTGRYTFDKGRSTYEVVDGKFNVFITSTSGTTYRYSFHIASEK